MDKERFRKLNILLNQNWNERHDIPQMHFTHLDLKWLMEQAEKVELYEKALLKIVETPEDSYKSFEEAYLETVRVALEVLNIEE